MLERKVLVKPENDKRNTENDKKRPSFFSETHLIAPSAKLERLYVRTLIVGKDVVTLAVLNDDVGRDPPVDADVDHLHREGVLQELRRRLGVRANVQHHVPHHIILVLVLDRNRLVLIGW